MRRMLLLFSLFVFAGCGAMAQRIGTGPYGGYYGGGYKDYGETLTQSINGEIVGCLSQHNGSYVLTDRLDKRFLLTGDTSGLSEYVGHGVNLIGVTGTVEVSAMRPNRPGAMALAEYSGKVPALQVSDVVYATPERCINNRLR